MAQSAREPEGRTAGTRDRDRELSAGAARPAPSRRRSRELGLAAGLIALGLLASAPPAAEGQATAPGQVDLITARAGDRKATLHFKDADDGGSPITRYEYRAKVATGSYPTSWTRVPEFTGNVGGTLDLLVAVESLADGTPLANGTAYGFQVRAVNGVGAGPPGEGTATPQANAAPTFTIGAEQGVVSRRPFVNAARVPADVSVGLGSLIDDDDGTDIAGTGDDRFTYEWEWLRVRGGDTTVVSGPRDRGDPGSDYVLTRADVGAQIAARVRWRDDRYNREVFTTAPFPSTGTILPAATCRAPTYTGGEEEVWSEEIRLQDLDHDEPTPNRYGVSNLALGSSSFAAGSNTYEIDFIYRATRGSEAGKFIFGLTADLAATDKNQLAVYVCDEEYPLLDATLQAQWHDYEWPSSEDWSTYLTRTIHVGRDAREPTPLRATIRGTSAELTIAFDETLDPGSVPDLSAFTVKVDTVAVNFATGGAAELDGADLTLTLEEARNPSSSAITVSYTRPGTGNLRDGRRNEVADFTALRVTAPPRPPPPPPPPGPRFTQALYVFELPEERDGRTEPIELGRVEATDLIGGSVEYELAEGDAERFGLDPASGRITYIGPGEDFETGPAQYALRVTARSPRGTATAAVEIRVTDRDVGPEAADDAAETPEDTPVTIAVLDNDSPGESGPLTLVEVSDPEHGTASATAGGGVLYTPEADYHGPDRFTYVVQDAAGARARAAVDVTVLSVDDPPRPGDDVAETPEDVPVVIAVLDNDDPGDDPPLSLVEVSDPEHGSAEVTAGGEVLYTPERNYHGPDRFTYVTEDAAGARARAAVEVTVLPVPDAPFAEDDQAETPEDAPVVIAVLDNDGDGDGDPLEVVEVSDPEHGTASVAAEGGILYTPEPNYHGPDAFTYTVGDPTGLTAQAAVEVTVVSVNDPPEAVGTIPDQELEAGDGPAALDVAPFFGDLDGDPLTYAATSSGSAVVAEVSGRVLTLVVARPGSATVTVTAEDPAGATATQSFGVTATDRRPRAILEDVLAAIGRGHLASARATLGRRMEATGPEETRVTLGGFRVPLGLGEAAARGRGEVERWLSALRGAGAPGAAGGGRGAGPEAGRSVPGVAPTLPFGALGRGSARGTGETEFLLTLGDVQAAPGARWTLWGQADVQGFGGEGEGAGDYDGSVRTAWVGVDRRLGERWMAGLAVSRSRADADWSYGSESGKMATSGVTSVQPYVRWSNGSTTVWAMAGGGGGTAASDRVTHGIRRESPLALRLGLVDLRRPVATLGGGGRLGLRADAAWARLSTGAGEEIVDGLGVDVNQVRVGVDVSGRTRTAGGTLLGLFGEVHGRRDGGSGARGTGLEVAGGFRLARGVFRIQGMGRLLALHTAEGYGERGAAVTLGVAEGSTGTGLGLSVSPRWGARTRASGALWEDEIRRRRAGAGRGDDERALDARLEYGVEVRGVGLLTPYGLYGQSQYGSRMEAGVRLRASGPFGLEIAGERDPLLDGGGDEYRLSALGRIDLAALRPR